MEKIYLGNSYVVNITRPGKTFPSIRIVRRKQTREHSKINGEEELRPVLGDTDAYNEVNIDETARLIGRVILDDSEIIRRWKDTRL